MFIQAELDMNRSTGNEVNQWFHLTTPLLAALSSRPQFAVSVHTLIVLGER